MGGGRGTYVPLNNLIILNIFLFFLYIMFKRPKIVKIVADAPVRRVIKKKPEIPDEVKQLQDEIKKIEEDENLEV